MERVLGKQFVSIIPNYPEIRQLNNKGTSLPNDEMNETTKSIKDLASKIAFALTF